jgi:hypothetical protein
MFSSPVCPKGNDVLGRPVRLLKIDVTTMQPRRKNEHARMTQHRNQGGAQVNEKLAQS